MTEDDRRGIWALWNFLSTGEIECTDGYRVSTQDHASDETDKLFESVWCEIPDEDATEDEEESEDDELCSNTCMYSNDGECDDGGQGSEYDECDLGTDCQDCGPRLM